MFVRVKKQAEGRGRHGNARMRYNFSLVESYREEGKVRQRTVAYLGTFLTSRQADYSTEIAPARAIHAWVGLYKRVAEVGRTDFGSVIEKAQGIIPIPPAEDWGTHLERQHYGRSEKTQVETEQYTATVKAVCEALRGARGTHDVPANVATIGASTQGGED